MKYFLNNLKNSLVYIAICFAISSCESNDRSKAGLERQISSKNNLQKLVWVPYWNEQNLNPSMHYPSISTLIYFGYDIDPSTGSYTDEVAINNWRKSPAIDSAISYRKQVLLCITSYGHPSNDKLLSNPKSWKTLVDSLNSILKTRNGNGIDIDFCDIPFDRKNEFLRFVHYLRSHMDSSYYISIHVYFEDLNSESLLLKNLASIVNSFVLVGYSNELSLAGPMSPLRSVNKNERSLESMLELYQEQGQRDHPLSLCLPLYGINYSKKYGREAERREIPYEDIIAEYTPIYSPRTDSISQSTQINIMNPADSASYQYNFIEYESSENLETKFNWARQRGFSGIGLWGIGYNGQDSRIWKLFSE